MNHNDEGTVISDAVDAAKSADYAIVFVATMSHEGGDRDSLSLDDGCVIGAKNGGTQCEGNNYNQNAMVEAIVAANPNTIVVARHLDIQASHDGGRVGSTPVGHDIT